MVKFVLKRIFQSFINNHGRRCVLLFLSSLPISVLHILDSDLKKTPFNFMIELTNNYKCHLLISNHVFQANGNVELG